jgi:hypothetical protein
MRGILERGLAMSCVEFSQVFVKRVIRLTVLLFVMAFLGGLAVSSGPGLAQDPPMAEEFEEFHQEMMDESGEFQDEFPAEFGGDDFEDLPPAVQAIVILIGLLFFLVLLSITIFIIYLLYTFLKALPPEYRLMDPTLVWLLLIPCFNLIWNFFVYPRIAKSYQNFFVAHGRTDVGDCGAGLGIAYAICAVLVSIPCVNYITGIFCGPAMLILLIIYLVRLHGLKREIQSGRFALDDPGKSPFAT